MRTRSSKTCFQLKYALAVETHRRLSRVESRLFAFLAESKVCLWEKLSDGLTAVFFHGVQPGCLRKKGGEDKMRPG